MKKALIYARHITYRKYEPTIAEQLCSCKQFANANNLEIINTYTDMSNEKLKTYEMFEKLKKECKQLNIDTIIVYSHCILGRIFTDILKLKRKMRKNGIDIIFVDIESSPYKELYKFFDNYIDNVKGGNKK